MWWFKKKFKVLKEWLWIDYNSLDNALFEQNLLITRLREENEALKDKIEFLTKCLDDRDKSITLMQKQEYPFWPVKTISEPTNWK